MPWRLANKPSVLERVISGVCYLTGGIAGILYIIIARPAQTQFFRYNFLQSIILTIIFFLLSWCNNIAAYFIQGAVQAAMGGNLEKSMPTVEMIFTCVNVVMMLLGLLPIYGMIAAFLGKMPPIPLISKVVRQQL
jgi:uncharacterized membrane protein